MSFKSKVVNYIKSAHPILWVSTHEDYRTGRDLENIATEQEYQFYQWSVTKGWITRQDGKLQQIEAEDPLTALESIIDFHDNSVLAIMNFHYYLDDPRILQNVKDLVQICKATNKIICFVDSSSSIPHELQKEIILLEYDFPTVDELAVVLDGLLSDVEGVAVHDDNMKRKVVANAKGMTLFEAENAFALSLVETKGTVDPAIVMREKAGTIKKSGILQYYEPKEGLEDVGGLDLEIEWLVKREKMFSEEAKAFGIPSGNGVLNVGVPGCGKSLLAKAIANTWKLPLLKLNAGSLFASHVGETEKNVELVIKLSVAMAPVVLWIDEIEKAFAGMGSSGDLDSGVTARSFGRLLDFMSDNDEDVFITATANKVQNLPPELLRKGRFDEIFAVDLPLDRERQEIFKIHIEKRGRDVKNYDIKKLSQSADGFSGSEIEQCVIDGLIEAFDEGSELKDEHIIKAIESTFPLSVTMPEQILQIRDWAKKHARPATKANGDVVEIKKGRSVRIDQNRGVA